MTKVNMTGFNYVSGQPLDGTSEAAEYLRKQGIAERINQFCDLHDLGDIDLNFDKGLESNSRANAIISNHISSLDPQEFILNIGGDHGMGLGTIHGLLNLHPESVIVWADAHGDINTPDISPTGNFHGMPLAFILNLCRDERFDWLKNTLQSHKLILIGQRDLDQGEREIIEKYNIQCFSSEEMNRMGTKEVLEIALSKADPMGICPIHLSFDVDLFDGHDIPSTGTRVYDGPRLEEVFLLGGLLGETGRLKSMDIVEFNPSIGTPDEVSASSELILDFIETTLKQVSERPMQRHEHLSAQFLSRMFGSDILR